MSILSGWPNLPTIPQPIDTSLNWQQSERKPENPRIENVWFALAVFWGEIRHHVAAIRQGLSLVWHWDNLQKDETATFG
jgi:hypothetical protein